MRKVSVVRWSAAGAVVVAVAAAGVLAGPATPAFAFGEPFRQPATSPHNADPTKAVTAVCPGSSRVFASGARINAGGGDVVLVGVVPDNGLTSVTAMARARPGFVGNWSVTAFAICDIPDAAGHREPAVSASSTATAACPGSKRLFGGGFRIEGAGAQAFVTGVVPDEGLTNVTVTAGGMAGPGATLTAYGICYDLAPGLQLTRTESAPVPFDGTWPKHAAANGTVGQSTLTYGVGGLIQGGPGDVFLDAFVPDPVLDAAGVRAVRVGPAALAALVADDEGSVTAYGIEIGTYC